MLGNLIWQKQFSAWKKWKCLCKTKCDKVHLKKIMITEFILIYIQIYDTVKFWCQVLLKLAWFMHGPGQEGQKHHCYPSIEH